MIRFCLYAAWFVSKISQQPTGLDEYFRLGHKLLRPVPLSFLLFNFISERELKFMFAICHRPSVCRLSVVCLSSVTLVHPT